MKKNRILIITCTLLLAVCLFLPTGVFADNALEYNDVNVYLSNVLRTTVALRSDTFFDTNTSTYFDCMVATSGDYAGHIYLCMQGGQPIDTGIVVTGLSQVSAQQSGGVLQVTYIQSAAPGGDSNNGVAPVYRVFFNTLTYDISINLAVNSSSIKLDTPVVSVSGNVITWSPISNAEGYNITYSSDGAIYNTVVTNLKTSSYSFSQSGYYKVQAIGVGSFYNSDWSNTVEATYSTDQSSGGLLDWLISRVTAFTSGIQTFFDSISSSIASIGEIFSSLTSFMPPQYSAVIWGLAGLLLMFGLFRLI